MRVKIRREDIIDGIPFQSRSCPIALAIKRANPAARYVCVTSNLITIDDDVYLTSDEIKRRIFVFDTTRRMSQFIIEFHGTKAIIP